MKVVKNSTLLMFWVLFGCSSSRIEMNNLPGDVSKIEQFVNKFHDDVKLKNDLKNYLPEWSDDQINEIQQYFESECGESGTLEFNETYVSVIKQDGVETWKSTVTGDLNCSSRSNLGFELTITGDANRLSIRSYRMVAH
jgi:hypothetical protein